MRITRIQRIINHRIYKDFNWPATLPDFAQFNVIYGWNGSGKTTLSNLFRHLQTKPPAIEGEVQYVIDKQVVTQDDLINAPLPSVRVFNRDSVDRSVFESAGKEFQPIYFLGEDSVEKQKQIDALKVQLEQKKQDGSNWRAKRSAVQKEREALCASEARIIKSLLTAAGATHYNQYDSRDLRATLQKIKINAEEYRLSAEKKSEFVAMKDSKIKAQIESLESNFPDLKTLTSSVRSLLGRSVVSNAIGRLVQDPDLASWVSTGLTLHQERHESGVCHFCEQPLPSARLAALEAHFNNELKLFNHELSSLIESIRIEQRSISGLRLPEKSLFYDHLIPEYEKATATFERNRAMVGMYFDKLLIALLAKKDRPFEVLELQQYLSAIPNDENTGWFWRIIDALSQGVVTVGANFGHEAVKQIDSIIKQHNQYSDNFLGLVDAARQKLEYSIVAEAAPKFAALDLSLADSERSITEFEQAASDLQQKIIDLERSIRQHQRPAEELNQEMRSYLGRSELSFEVKENGYSITRNGKPALHLSEGERTAIAFMYFLKSLEDVAFDLKNGVVVIDDPVSSLDANSLYSAFGFLKDRTKNVGQLFILTHNFTFFRQVRNWFYKLPNQGKKDLALQPARFYSVVVTGQGGDRKAAIQAMDAMLHQYESEYHYLFKLVYTEAHAIDMASVESSYGLPNVARRVLESFLAFRLPGTSGDLYHKLEHIQFDIAKKTRIIRFLHTHSHYDQIAEPEHDLSVLSETRAILQDILHLMQHADPSHYDAMETLMPPRPVAMPAEITASPAIQAA